MIIEIDYKRANLDFRKALAASLGVAASRVEVLVTPANSLIPFCADWRTVASCADAVAKVDGEILQLNII